MRKCRCIIIAFCMLLLLGGCHKKESENYTAKIIVTNQSKYTFKAIDLTYLDKNGNKQVLLSGEVPYKESATFELEGNGDLTFTIGGTVENVNLEEYTNTLTESTELWLDAVDGGDGLKFSISTKDESF